MQGSRFVASFSLGALAGVGAAAGLLRLKYPERYGDAELPAARVEPDHDDLFKYGRPTLPISAHTHTSHSLCYDRSRRVPTWVSERITRERVQSTAASRKASRFQPDPSLPPQFSATNDDYRGSGWSRGHMTPAADCKHCQMSMNESFYLTNVVPQDFSNNSGYWNRLEWYCRDLTKSYDSVNVISGPLFLPEEDEESGKKIVKYEVIGKNGVAVPTHLFKVILAEDNTRPSALGVFIVPNKPLGDINLTRFQVTLHELETLTGTMFHSTLDRNQVQDLCKSDACKLMSVEKMAMIGYARSLQSAHTLQQLDALWREMEGKGLHPDDTLRQKYSKRKLELSKDPDSSIEQHTKQK